MRPYFALAPHHCRPHANPLSFLAPAAHRSLRWPRGRLRQTPAHLCQPDRHPLSTLGVSIVCTFTVVPPQSVALPPPPPAPVSGGLDRLHHPHTNLSRSSPLLLLPPAYHPTTASSARPLDRLRLAILAPPGRPPPRPLIYPPGRKPPPSNPGNPNPDDGGNGGLRGTTLKFLKSIASLGATGLRCVKSIDHSIYIS